MNETALTIRVRLFAQAREIAGHSELSLDSVPAMNVASVRRELVRRHPLLEPLLERSVLAVNREYAADDRPVQPGDEVAVVPPVAGG
jgi:molybdopterin converting factor subunit 1